MLARAVSPGNIRAPHFQLAPPRAGAALGQHVTVAGDDLKQLLCLTDLGYWRKVFRFQRFSCLLRLLYTLTVDSSRLGGGFEELRKFFYFSKPVIPIAGFCRYFHDMAFLPFRSQLTISLLS